MSQKGKNWTGLDFQALVDIVNAAGMSLNLFLMILNLIPLHQGCLLIYLPAYLPDLNPIEESSSTCECLYVISPFWLTTILCSESFSSPTCCKICANEEPKLALMEACGCITAKKAQSWFHHSGYIWNTQVTAWMLYNTNTIQFIRSIVHYMKQQKQQVLVQLRSWCE